MDGFDPLWTRVTPSEAEMVETLARTLCWERLDEHAKAGFRSDAATAVETLRPLLTGERHLPREVRLDVPSMMARAYGPS